MYDYDKQQRYFSVSPANNANEMNNFFKTKTENCVDKWFVGLWDCSTISSWLFAAFANLIHHAHELLFCNPHAFAGATAEEGLSVGGPSKSTDKRSSATSRQSDKSFFFLFFYTLYTMCVYINRHTNAQLRKYHTNQPPFSIQFRWSIIIYSASKTRLPSRPVSQSPCLSVWRLNDGCFHLKGNRNTLVPGLEWISMTLLAFMPGQLELKSRRRVVNTGETNRGTPFSVSVSQFPISTTLDFDCHTVGGKKKTKRGNGFIGETPIQLHL